MASSPYLLQAIDRLRAVLQKEGVRPALIFLNSLTSHRFSSIYLFHGEVLRTLVFYDRQHPEATSSPDIPITASYCIFVKERAERIVIDDALHDVLAGLHPKRQEVQAYCGVPLLDRHGTLIGTVCHFDIQPMSISNDNVELMENFGELIGDTLDLNRPAPAA